MSSTSLKRLLFDTKLSLFKQFYVPKGLPQNKRCLVRNKFIFNYYQTIVMLSKNKNLP